MAAGKISLQANDGKIAGLVFEDGAVANVTATVPKEGGTLVVENADHSIGDGTQTFKGFGGSGFKNFIINGNFDVWQYGTSQTTTGYGSADRWSSNITGNGTFQMSRSIVDTLNGRRINTYATSLITVGTTTEIGLATRLEDMMRFAGKTLTLSFYAISDSTAPIKVYYGRYYTSLIYCGAIDVGNGESGALTRYTTTFTVPAYAGESYSPVNSFLEILIRQARTTVGGFRVAQVQLEEGSVATPFENRLYGLELSLCQRYLPAITNDISSSLVGQCISATQAIIPIPFKVVSRVAPAGILITTGNGITQITNSGGGGVTTTAPATLYFSSVNGATLKSTVANSLVAGDACMPNIQGTILFTGCEL